MEECVETECKGLCVCVCVGVHWATDVGQRGGCWLALPTLPGALKPSRGAVRGTSPTQASEWGRGRAGRAWAARLQARIRTLNPGGGGFTEATAPPPR